MKRAEDISILITDKSFQKILSEWTGFSEERKAEIYSEYELTAKDVEILLQLWFGLDFHSFEHPQTIIEEVLEETIWKLAERKNTPSEKHPIKRLYEQFARIAAILIIPIIIYTTYIQFFKVDQNLPAVTSRLVTVSSQSGTIINMTLPDGSEVCLNAGSSISYPNHFDGSTRKVLLTGEAYFQVVKNKKVPMVVSAGNVNLKVYGTSFNVNAFPYEESVKVTLVEGSVSLSSPSGRFKGKKEFFIEPGQTVAYFDNSKKLTVLNEDTFFYTAWKDGILVFRNNTFATVLKQLSRKFNVDIELKDQNLASIPMDATFRDENINEILRLLALSTPFRYYYDSPRKLPDGTFAKSKIYIDKNKD
ncbi:MAG TPA: FecR domain-containing protein [Prolixibacteraceae bacterium]|nr:FecR domain-containing protein [Prolixibacteraceae bacterium]